MIGDSSESDSGNRMLNPIKLNGVFPDLINNQVNKLNELDQSTKKALTAAVKAEERASNARNKSAAFGHKKAAIEELQTAVYTSAEAIQSIAESQQVSFEFQTKLAEVSKYLFALGASNIAANRIVVRELELRLKDASEEQISELARQELLAVVNQLKEQEDILIKIEQQKSRLSTLKLSVKEIKLSHTKSQSELSSLITSNTEYFKIVDIHQTTIDKAVIDIESLKSSMSNAVSSDTEQTKSIQSLIDAQKIINDNLILLDNKIDTLRYDFRMLTYAFLAIVLFAIVFVLYFL